MRTRSVALVLVVAALLSACSPDESGSSEPEAAPAEVTGVILAIDSEGLGEINSFDLKEGEERYQIFIDPEVDYGFNIGHLNEHLSSGQPVRVDLEERDGKLFAQSIVDA